jgi:hypothetical protein
MGHYAGFVPFRTQNFPLELLIQFVTVPTYFW